MYFLRIIRVARFVFKFFNKQIEYNSGFIDSFLEPFCNEYEKNISPIVLQKIKKYYCLGIPVTCSSYKKIYGKSLSEKERRLATLTGIVTPIIDDFTDEKTLSNDRIESLIFNPNDYFANTLEEKIVKHILCAILEEVPNPGALIKVSQRIIKAQQLSVRQMAMDVTEDELLQITLLKGAWSHISFHYLLDEIPDEETVAVLYKMGGLLQMSNDIFDVYKDYHEGIKTIPNTCSDYSKLETYYFDECRSFCTMARLLPYRKKDIEFFITFISFVMARGIVALQMLKSLQEKFSGGELPIDKLDRKELICDMEKPVNAFKTAWHTYRIIRG